MKTREVKNRQQNKIKKKRSREVREWEKVEIREKEKETDESLELNHFSPGDIIVPRETETG